MNIWNQECAFKSPSGSVVVESFFIVASMVCGCFAFGLCFLI